MPTLIHTRLHVPDRHPVVTALSELETSHGVAWVAAVELDGHRIGTFENDGHGAATCFIPRDSSVYSIRDFERFAAACTRDGSPVTSEDVMVLLVEEYDSTVMTRDVHGLAGTYARQVADGWTVDYTHVAQRPRTEQERARLARLLNEQRPPPPDLTVAWEVWTGTAWEPLPLPPYD
jgi:hypothetical protein